MGQPLCRLARLLRGLISSGSWIVDSSPPPAHPSRKPAPFSAGQGHTGSPYPLPLCFNNARSLQASRSPALGRPLEQASAVQVPPALPGALPILLSPGISGRQLFACFLSREFPARPASAFVPVQGRQRLDGQCILSPLANQSNLCMTRTAGNWFTSSIMQMPVQGTDLERCPHN